MILSRILTVSYFTNVRLEIASSTFKGKKPKELQVTLINLGFDGGKLANLACTDKLAKKHLATEPVLVTMHESVARFVQKR